MDVDEPVEPDTSGPGAVCSLDLSIEDHNSHPVGKPISSSHPHTCYNEYNTSVGASGNKGAPFAHGLRDCTMGKAWIHRIQ